jgi:hypothetical protein
MLTVIHTADLHLGKNRRYPDYLEQQGWMLDAIVRLVVERLRDPTGQVWLIVAGDIFERNEDTNREEVTLFMMRLLLPVFQLAQAHPNFFCFMIDGNHDRQPGALPSVLSPFDGLSNSQVVIRSKQPLHLPEHRLLLVPFDDYREAQLHQLIARHPSQFVVFHECLARMQTDTGYSPPRDQDDYIEVENLIEGQVVGMFVGDIHRCQPLDSRRVCWYSGSPVTHDFGHRLPKGVLVHRFVKDGRDLWVRDQEPELVDLPDDRIRSHHQLGRILRVDDIPMEFLRGFKSRYLNLTVTPEVYQAIDRELPEFFHGPTVSYEFDRAEPTEVVDETLDDTVDQGAILRWIDDNLVELAGDERDDVRARVFQDFSAR